MPFNGVGTFTSLGAPTFPAIPNELILATYFNATMNDVFGGLTNAMTRDGQSTALANLPMGGFKLTGLSAGTLNGDSLTFGQTGAAFGTGFTLSGADATISTVAVTATGAWNFTTGSGRVLTPTRSPGDSGTDAASTAFVQAAIAAAGTLPSLTGNSLKYLQVNAGETAAVWVSAPAGALSGLTAATGSATLTNANNPIRWNWTQTTAAQTGFYVGETTASTSGAGSQYLMQIGTVAASTANPLRVQARGSDIIDVSRVGGLTLRSLDGTTGSGAAGSDINIMAGGGAAANAGGTVTIQAGGGFTSGVGGNVTINAATGGASGRAGILTLNGGISSAAQSGNSGGIVLAAGHAGTVASVAGGPISIVAGNGSTTTTGGVGGALTIQSGAGGLGLGGGLLSITGGQGGASGAGGAVQITSGLAGSTGNGGAVTISTGTTTNGIAGDITIQQQTQQIASTNGIRIISASSAGVAIKGAPISITAGNGSSTTTGGSGGDTIIKSGNGNLAAAGGNMTVQSGTGGTSGAGGQVNIFAGAGGVTGTNQGGGIAITGGAGGSTGTGGIVNILGGSGTGNNAGDVSLRGGNATSARGGAVTVAAGTSGGTSAGNDVNITASNGSSNTGGDIALTIGTGTTNGAINFSNSGVANGTVATTITSLGPTGSSTTIVGWLRIKVAGTVRYLPYW